MSELGSQVNPNSADYKANYAGNKALAEQLAERQQLVALDRSERVIDLQRQRGKLLTRERIEALIDPGGAFLELSPLAAWDMYDGEAPGAGIVTGIGRISGVDCMIIANDPTVKGGTYFPETVRKHLRAQTIAEENRLTTIYLVDRAAHFSIYRRTSSPTAITSAASSTTWRACRPQASPKSPRFSVRARPAGPISLPWPAKR